MKWEFTRGSPFRARSQCNARSSNSLDRSTSAGCTGVCRPCGPPRYHPALRWPFPRNLRSATQPWNGCARTTRTAQPRPVACRFSLIPYPQESRSRQCADSMLQFPRHSYTHVQYEHLQTGVDPILWTPDPLARRRNPRCRARGCRIRRYSGSRWSSWFGPDGHRASWLGSSSHRPRRYATGSRRLSVMAASGPTACVNEEREELRRLRCMGRPGTPGIQR